MQQHASSMLDFRGREHAREHQYRHLLALGTIEPGAVTLETHQPSSRAALVLLVICGAAHLDPPPRA